MNKNIIIKCCILPCFIIVVFQTYSYAKDAPLFALFSNKGDLVQLSSVIKKSDVLIVFFASYCAPCKTEIPEIIKLHDRYGSRFNLLFVNIDKEGKPAAESVLNELGIINYTCLLDIYQKSIKKYSPLLTIPAFFLVDKKGKIKYESIGYKAESINSFEKYLDAVKK